MPLLYGTGHKIFKNKLQDAHLKTKQYLHFFDLVDKG